MKKIEIYLTDEDFFTLERIKADNAKHDRIYAEMKPEEYAEILLHRMLNSKEKTLFSCRKTPLRF
ncbi:MAG: hypothetical protein IJ644_10365 [Oscillospiraceae bacterium]|nr:hypothetical protein [Oscillospiraceae bacterium]